MLHALRSIVAGLAVAVVLWLLPALPAQPAKAAVLTPERLMSLKQIGGVQVSPDGKRVLFTTKQALVEGDRSEYLIHIHSANADGSQSRQLTQGNKSCDQPQWSPDGGTIAFLSSRGGKRDVWLLPAQGGEAQRLTGTRTAVSSFKWSPDSKAVAFTSLDAPTAEEEKAAKTKNDARVVDDQIKMSRLYVIAVGDAKAEARLLTKGNYSVASGARGGYDWSPDGKTLAFSHTRTPRPDDWPTADLSLVEVATATVKPLAQTPAAEFSPVYSPDGKTIAFVASDNPPTWGGTGIAHVIPATGSSPPRPLAETHDRWSRYSDLLGWSADGKRLYFTEARGTYLTVNALPLDGKPEVISQGEGEGWMTGVSLNATRTAIGFSWEKTNQAPEAYVSKAEKFEPAKVSNINVAQNDLSLSETKVIRWQSADKQEVEGLLTYPANYEKGKRYPLLLVIHGGPMGVFSQSYTAAPSPYPVAAFASRGYAVLRANPRGSSGYGHKFRYANYNDWGGGDFKDLMTGVDRVIELGLADKDRLGVMGWSYGGFMTSWTVTQTKRFKAASVGAGVTNLVSFTGTADIPGFLPDYFGGEFWDKGETYRNHSAMFHVKGVSTPTLIQHGERDDRVPLSQGLEFHNALKRQNCPVKMVIYPRTPHGIEEPKLLVDAMTRNLQWFEDYVKAGGQ